MLEDVHPRVPIDVSAGRGVEGPRHAELLLVRFLSVDGRLGLVLQYLLREHGLLVICLRSTRDLFLQRCGYRSVILPLHCAHLRIW